MAAEAVIDNGKLGKRVSCFEISLLTRQATNSTVMILGGETVVFAAATVGRQPKDRFDFFPLIVDVEEKQYAAGRVPGSFFHREGRPGMGSILTARLIDRSLHPVFVEGLHNETRVVDVVMAVRPDEAYDVMAINALSMSTRLAGLSLPRLVNGTRLSPIDGQWAVFPTYPQMKQATFNTVVTGYTANKDVATMIVETGGGGNTWELIQASRQASTEEAMTGALRAAEPVIRGPCRAQSEVAAKIAKETAEYPLFPDYEDNHFKVTRTKIRVNLSETI